MLLHCFLLLHEVMPLQLQKMWLLVLPLLLWPLLSRPVMLQHLV
jgi:hypothetical protein